MDFDPKIQDAANQLTHTIAIKLGDLADEITGAPESGSDEWVAQYKQRDTPEGHARLREWHLVKIAISHTAHVDAVGDVINARRWGASWQAIADRCGITRQAAHDRWATTVEANVRLDAEAHHQT